MRRSSFLATLLVSAAFALPAAAPAGAAVYWASESGVGVANLDGSQAIPVLPARPALPGMYLSPLNPGEVCGMAVDGSHIYWANRWAGTIGRANLDGTGANEILITGLGDPCGVAVDGSYVYWADSGANTIGRARLDGSEVRPAFIPAGNRPCGLDVEAGYLYWALTSDDAIGRARVDGGEVEREFVTDTESPCGVGAGDGYVFWASMHEYSENAGTISRASLDGTAVSDPLIVVGGEPYDVAVGAGYVYWADRGWRHMANGGSPTTMLPGSIGRARLDGSEPNPRLIGVPLVGAIATDSRVLSGDPPPPRSSDFLRFGSLKHNKREGSLRLDVFVPARGEFKVEAPAIGWKLDKGNPPPYLQGSFRWRLKLWPGKGTDAARRVHRQLRRDGRAPIVLRVTYQQEGRTAIKATKRIAFTR